MQKTIKYLGYLDWILSGATLLYGIFTLSAWLIAGGLLGFALAWYAPAKRLQKLLGQSLLSKQSRRRAASDAEAALSAVQIVEEAEGSEAAAAAASITPAAPAPVIGFNRSYPPHYSDIRLSRSKHNAWQANSTNLFTHEPLGKHS